MRQFSINFESLPEISIDLSLKIILLCQTLSKNLSKRQDRLNFKRKITTKGPEFILIGRALCVRNYFKPNIYCQKVITTDFLFFDFHMN